MKTTILAGALTVLMAAAAHAQSGYGYGYRGGYGGGYGGGYPGGTSGGYGWGTHNPGYSWGGSWGGSYGGFWGAGGWGYGYPGFTGGGWGYGGMYFGGGPDGSYWFSDTPDYYGPRYYIPGVNPNPAPEKKKEEKKAEPPLWVRSRSGLDEGRALFARGDARGAVEAFRAALLRDVDDPVAQAWFGLALAAGGDAKNADKAIRMAAAKAVRLDLSEGERERLSKLPGDGLAAAWALSLCGKPEKLRELARKDASARALAGLEVY